MENPVIRFIQNRSVIRYFSIIALIFVTMGLEGCSVNTYYPPAPNMIGRDTPSDRAPLSRHDYRWNRQLEGW